VTVAPKEYLSVNFSRSGVRSTLKTSKENKPLLEDFQKDVKVAFSNYSKNSGTYRSFSTEIKDLWSLRSKK
jgi:hypothetical protein